MLAAIGMKEGDDVEMLVQDGNLVISALKPPRQGWAEDAQRIAEAGDDRPILGEFGNEGDDDLRW